MKLFASTQRQRGMAVILIIALLALMFVFVMAGAQRLAHLKTELKLIERDQTNRLALPRRP